MEMRNLLSYFSALGMNLLTNEGCQIIALRKSLAYLRNLCPSDYYLTVEQKAKQERIQYVQII
jgi:hypothetical protein